MIIASKKSAVSILLCKSDAEEKEMFFTIIRERSQITQLKANAVKAMFKGIIMKIFLVIKPERD